MNLDGELWFEFCEYRYDTFVIVNRIYTVLYLHVKLPNRGSAEYALPSNWDA